MFGARLFGNWETFEFPTFWKLQTYVLKCARDLSWIFIGVLVSPKITIIGFYGGLDTSPDPEIIEMRVFGLSHKQIENYDTKSKQNNSLELLIRFFNQFTIKMARQMLRNHITSLP